MPTAQTSSRALSSMALLWVLLLTICLLAGCSAVEQSLPRELPMTPLQRMPETLRRFEPTGCGLSRISNSAWFDKHHPRAIRMAVLTWAWDEAPRRGKASRARLGILSYLMQPSHPAGPWSEALTARILDGVTDEDALVRRQVLNLLARRPEVRLRAQVKRFQNDPDDRIRESAMLEISRWPTARPLFEAYVRKHRREPAYRASVAKALFFLAKQPPCKSPPLASLVRRDLRIVLGGTSHPGHIGPGPSKALFARIRCWAAQYETALPAVVGSMRTAGNPPPDDFIDYAVQRITRGDPTRATQLRRQLENIR